MSAEEIVNQVIDALNGAGIPYMLVGSFSSNFYGIARSTKDADFVVNLGDIPPSEVGRRLGLDFHLDPQMSFETITGTTRFIASHPKSAFTVEFFLLSDDPHDRQRFARRRKEMMPGREAFVPSPEDVVITKLRWSKGGNRRKDIDDVRNVIFVQQDAMDWGYVEKWCDIHGTRELLNRIRSEVNPNKLP